MHNVKSFAAKAINKALERTGPVWQQSFYDRVIRDNAHVAATVEYIHRNPVAEGLIDRPEDYLWRSANPAAGTDVEKFWSA